MNRFVVVDVDCGLDRALLHDVAEAAQVHLERDFGQPAPAGYGCSGTVRVAKDPHDIQPGEVVVALLAHPDQPGALGYHDRAPNGAPLIKVFPLLDSLDNLGVTLTHELDEELADAELSTLCLGADGKLRAREPGDPVETLSYGIKVASGRTVLVTDFVTPAYFEPPDDARGVRFDFLGRVKSPGEILPGGYQSFYVPGHGWTQEVNGAMRAYRAVLADLGHGRHARRANAPRASAR